MAQRKKAMKERILLKQKVEKSDLEKEAEERGNYLLQRAYRMRLEQEDEIKDMEKVGHGRRLSGSSLPCPSPPAAPLPPGSECSPPKGRAVLHLLP